MRRRTLLCGAALAPLGALALPAVPLRFPRDHGSHPALRTEWWYLTGHVTAGGREFGFQVTFFRSRVDAAAGLTSRFAAHQLLFAHAAVTDVQGGKLWHDQRVARAGFGIAQALEADADIRLRGWTLKRTDAGTHAGWQAQLAGQDFSLQLDCAAPQPVLLQGAQGLSRKGPEDRQASYYYSQPQLQVQGSLRLQGQAHTVRGKAWLDHEWSEEILHPEAVGWDWIGMNLHDGGAVTAFRLRRKDGSTLWDGGSYRAAGGSVYPFSKGEAVFSPQRRWKSPLSQASYPVEWIVRTPADFYTVKAVLDNQELDSRGSTGAIYWEGLSRLFDSNGREVGSGYLEMTGYAQALRL